MKIRHFVEQGGRYYWQPSAALRRAGWTQQRLARTTGDRADAIAEAVRINRRVDDWRRDTTGGQPPDAATVARQIAAWRRSDHWRGLAPETRRAYTRALERIEAWFGKQQLRAVSGDDLRRRVKPMPPQAAAILLRVAHTLWARDGAPWPAPDLRRTARRAVEPRIWTNAETMEIVAVADQLGRPSVGDAVILAHWLGHNPCDLARLQRRHYQDNRFTFRRAKTGARISTPASPAVAARVAAALARQAADELLSPWLLLCEETGRPYPTGGALVKAFRKVRAAAAMENPTLAPLRFAWLRHTAVVRLAEAGAQIPEIAAWTGHSLATVHRILEHYLPPTDPLAATAAAKRLKFEERIEP